MAYPYGASAVDLGAGQILIAFEKWINPVALPFKSEIDTVRIHDSFEIVQGPFSLNGDAKYFYNPHFIQSGGLTKLYFNSFDVVSKTAHFEVSSFVNGKLANSQPLNAPDSLAGQLRPWFFPFVHANNSITISYEFKNLNEHPDAEIQRNHLKMASSTDGMEFDPSVDFGVGVMPRNAEFKNGVRIFTRQNGLADKMMVFFRLNRDGTHWSDELPISSQVDVHDAFPFQRMDGGVDLYYIASGGGDGNYVVYRRSVNQEGQMGPEMPLTDKENGSFMQPHPARLSDGRVLLLMTKEVTAQINYDLWALYLDGDSLAQFNDPGACSYSLQKSSYEAVYKCQMSQVEKFKGTPEETIFNQYTAFILSYLGKDLEAKKVFDLKTAKSDKKNDIDLKGYKAVSAAQALTKAAANKQILLINEAHHIPQTRLLTIQMLKPLYDLGYRYLAAETFDERNISSVNADGVPTRDTGFYTAEPTFALMVREAKRLGYQLIPYEYITSCDPFHESPQKCQNVREQGQAQNLYDRIFAKDPHAKVLVHAGYAHIDKMGDGDGSGGWVSMGKYLWDLTKIEPFSVDQTIFLEHGNPNVETPGFRDIVKTFSISNPSVLQKEDDSFWVLPKYKSHIDVQVILPPEVMKNGRPDWRNQISGVRAISYRNSYCKKGQSCLLQAILQPEDQRKNFVPFDQILLSGPEKTQLFLTTGKFKLRLINLKTQKIIKESIMEVH